MCICVMWCKTISYYKMSHDATFFKILNIIQHSQKWYISLQHIIKWLVSSFKLLITVLKEIIRKESGYSLVNVNSCCWLTNMVYLAIVWNKDRENTDTAVQWRSFFFPSGRTTDRGESEGSKLEGSHTVKQCTGFSTESWSMKSDSRFAKSTSWFLTGLCFRCSTKLWFTVMVHKYEYRAQQFEGVGSGLIALVKCLNGNGLFE